MHRKCTNLTFLSGALSTAVSLNKVVSKYNRVSGHAIGRCEPTRLYFLPTSRVFLPYFFEETIL